MNHSWNHQSVEDSSSSWKEFCNPIEITINFPILFTMTPKCAGRMQYCQSCYILQVVYVQMAGEEIGSFHCQLFCCPVVTDDANGIQVIAK